MISVQCPKCGKVLKAPPAAAGKRVKCAGCSEVFLLPEAETLELAQVAPQAAETPAPPTSTPAPQAPIPSTVEVSCPHCRGAVLLDPQMAGQIVGCPHCQGQIVVPSAAPDSAPQLPPIVVICPHCHTTQIFSARLAGQVAGCPQCKQAVQLPVPHVPMLAPVPMPLSPPSPVKASKSAFAFDGRDEDEDGPVLRPKHRGSGGGTSALIWGLISFFLFPPLGFIAISVANSARRYNKSDGKATVGLVLGWISVIETILGCCIGVPIIAWIVIAAKQQMPMVQ